MNLEDASQAEAVRAHPNLLREPPQSHQHSNEAYWLWYIAGCIGLTIAYLVVLLATVEQSLWDSASDSLANMAPPALIGLVARPTLRWLRALRPIKLVGAIAGCAVLYALAWYLCLGITLGAANLVQGEQFRFAFLEGAGRVWQVYQGMLLFGLLLAFAAFWEAQVALDELRSRPVAPTPMSTETKQPEAGPFLMRTAEGLKPVDAAEILAIEAQDDASMVILRTQRILVRTSLAQWERQLPPQVFLRVHRGWIVNLATVTSFEPSGEGRMNAYLPGGLVAPVSRSGARLVRELAA